MREKRERGKKKQNKRSSLEPEPVQVQERKKQGNKLEFGGFSVDLIERSESFKESIFWVFLRATDSVLLGLKSISSFIEAF